MVICFVNDRRSKLRTTFKRPVYVRATSDQHEPPSRFQWRDQELKILTEGRSLRPPRGIRADAVGDMILRCRILSGPPNSPEQRQPTADARPPQYTHGNVITFSRVPFMSDSRTEVQCPTTADSDGPIVLADPITVPDVSIESRLRSTHTSMSDGSRVANVHHASSARDTPWRAASQLLVRFPILEK
ncbi:hypothetical protein B0H13DRAFT_1888439 [Mycena leptocephala]|nr:hypothetical protein B0H13DRAFT_1888439 [Mycena leptocephala]